MTCKPIVPNSAISKLLTLILTICLLWVSSIQQAHAATLAPVQANLNLQPTSSQHSLATEPCSPELPNPEPQVNPLYLPQISGGRVAFHGFSDVITDAEGRILVTGSEGDSLHDQLVLARYAVDGCPDLSFGSDGKVLTTFESAQSSIGQALIIDENGRIIVAGIASVNIDTHVTLARYNRDGSLDTSFGGTGTLLTDLATLSEAAQTVAIDRSGRIVVVGHAEMDSMLVPALVRYNRDGTLDASFDGDGKLLAAVGAGTSETVSGVAIDAAGHIVVVGAVIADDARHFAVTRYNADGSLDVSFDGDGKVITDFGSTYGGFARDVLIDDRERILVVGFANTESFNRQFALARYNSDGSLDTTFDGDGKVVTDFEMADNAFGEALAIDSDGHIVVTGIARGVSDGDFKIALARYNSKGSLDPSFDGDGKVVTDIPSSIFDMASGVVIDRNGGIVVVGEAHVSLSKGSYSVLMRYNNDGSLDTSFNRQP